MKYLELTKTFFPIVKVFENKNKKIFILKTGEIPDRPVKLIQTPYYGNCVSEHCFCVENDASNNFASDFWALDQSPLHPRCLVFNRFLELKREKKIRITDPFSALGRFVPTEKINFEFYAGDRVTLLNRDEILEQASNNPTIFHEDEGINELGWTDLDFVYYGQVMFSPLPGHDFAWTEFGLSWVDAVSRLVHESVLDTEDLLDTDLEDDVIHRMDNWWKNRGL